MKQELNIKASKLAAADIFCLAAIIFSLIIILIWIMSLSIESIQKFDQKQAI